jgi:hypothetical protein
MKLNNIEISNYYVETKIVELIKNELKCVIDDVMDGVENNETHHFDLNEVDNEIVEFLKSLNEDDDLRVDINENVGAAIYYSNFYNDDYEIVVEVY